jgi:hypothetical protein
LVEDSCKIDERQDLCRAFGTGAEKAAGIVLIQ